MPSTRMQENVLLSSKKRQRSPFRVELPTPGDEFRNAKIANRRLLLTYKTHLDKDAWIEWLTTKTKITPDFVRLAHETGDKTNPYNHTHCVIDFGKVFQSINMSYFDYENIHPHIRVLKSAKALKDAKTYIAKEDPANKDLLVETTPVADIVWSKDSFKKRSEWQKALTLPGSSPCTMPRAKLSFYTRMENAKTRLANETDGPVRTSHQRTQWKKSVLVLRRNRWDG